MKLVKKSMYYSILKKVVLFDVFALSVKKNGCEDRATRHD